MAAQGNGPTREPSPGTSNDTFGEGLNSPAIAPEMVRLNTSGLRRLGTRSCFGMGERSKSRRGSVGASMGGSFVPSLTRGKSSLRPPQVNTKGSENHLRCAVGGEQTAAGLEVSLAKQRWGMVAEVSPGAMANRVTKENESGKEKSSRWSVNDPISSRRNRIIAQAAEQAPLLVDELASEAPWYLLSPRRNFTNYWNVLSSFILLYVAIFTPFEVRACSQPRAGACAHMHADTVWPRAAIRFASPLSPPRLCAAFLSPPRRAYHAPRVCLTARSMSLRPSMCAQVAFIPPPVTANDPLFLLGRIIDIFFLIDMLLQFFTMYPRASNGYNRGGSASAGSELETRFTHIVRNYLRGWFLLDLLSLGASAFDIVPFMLKEPELTTAKATGEADVDSERLSILTSFRVVRVLRLIKLARLMKASRRLKDWFTSIPTPRATVTIVTLITRCFFVTHWFGCVLGLITNIPISPLDTWLATHGCARRGSPSSPPAGRTVYTHTIPYHTIPYHAACYRFMRARLLNALSVPCHARAPQIAARREHTPQA